MSRNTQINLLIVTTFCLVGLAAQASDSSTDLIAATVAVHGIETPVATAAATTPPKSEVIGWCLGGRWSLRSALLLPDAIDAMIMYYGAVVTDEARLATLQMPLLGNFAEKDPIIRLDGVNEFASTLDKLGKDVDVKIYAGTSHGFSNSSGMAYDAEAAEDA